MKIDMEIFSVLDTVAGRFLDPFTAPTMEYAIRSFGEACGTDGHQFAKFPEDYSLHHVGSFDATLGEVAGVTARKIAMAVQFSQGYGNQLEMVKPVTADQISEAAKEATDG